MQWQNCNNIFFVWERLGVHMRSCKQPNVTENFKCYRCDAIFSWSVLIKYEEVYNKNTID